MRKNTFLIPYITAGFPSRKLFLPILKVLFDSEVDFIEVGVPHSDPLADGPVIQNSSKIAIKNGVTLRWIVETLRANSLHIQKTKSLILFSYLNPILQYGFEKLLKDLPKSLFYGCIIPDLPLEEAKKYLKLFRKYNLNLILLATPNTKEKKVREIAKASGGFIYLVSITGTTGVRKQIAGDLKRKIKELKSFTKKPVVVGFGIGNIKQARKVISFGADGVVIGSAIIKLLSDKRLATKKLAKYINSFKK